MDTLDAGSKHDECWGLWFRAIQFAPRRVRWRLARHVLTPSEPIVVDMPLRSGLTMRLDLSDEYQRTIAACAYEYDALQVTSSVLRRGDCVIDVGANIGLHSLVWAKAVGPLGRVLSFEPVPPNFERLMLNIGLNPQVTCLEPFNVALGDAPGQLRLSALENRAGLTSGGYSATRGGERGYLVEQTTLDSAIESMDLGPVRLLKMDVEGWETKVIAGAMQTIARHRPHIAMEWNRDYGRNEELYNVIWQQLVAELRYRPTRIARSAVAGQGKLIDLPSDDGAWPRHCNLLLIP